MPFLLALLAIAAAGYFWLIRARNAAAMTQDLMDVANDVRLAARRFGFTRQANVHPAEAVEDPRICVATLGVSFLELDAYPTAEQKDALVSGLREALRISHDEAEELVILGRWLMTECNGPAQAIPRMARKLNKLSGQDLFDPLMRVIKIIARYGTGDLSQKQKTALEDVQRGLRIS